MNDEIGPSLEHPEPHVGLGGVVRERDEPKVRKFIRMPDAWSRLCSFI